MSRNNGNNSGFCQEGQSGYDRCQASCPLPYGFIPCVEPIDSCGRIGPTGATGPTGSRGETGPAGIRGESGPRGLPGERGPQGERGLQGIQGEQGQQGLRGERGIPGARGEQGLPGPRGPIAATIPFSIAGNGYGQGIQISTDEEGKPRAVNFAGFGEANSYQPLQLKPGEWDEGIITIDQGAHFPSSFVMPYDGTLRNVFAVFANREPMILPTGLLLRPFVCLATSDSTSLSFQILKETITYVEPYVGSEEEIPKYSLRTGSKMDLDLPLARGTLVVIMVGWVGEGENPEYSSLVSMSGGLFLD